MVVPQHGGGGGGVTNMKTILFNNPYYKDPQAGHSSFEQPIYQPDTNADGAFSFFIANT